MSAFTELQPLLADYVLCCVYVVDLHIQMSCKSPPWYEVKYFFYGKQLPVTLA